jgi:ubiquinone/menaquinone biosynthesis C-methylase UbiE
MSEALPALDRRSVFDEIAHRWDDMHPASLQDAAVARGLALVGDLDGRMVADVGCGTGIIEGHLLRRIKGGRVLAIDSSSGMMAQARAKHSDTRVEWLCADVLGAGVAPASIDVVLCYNTWPHFDDPASVARELARWLKPRGVALVWHDIGRDRLAAIHSEAGGPIAHDRLLPVAELGALFSQSGFGILQAEEDADSYTLLARRSCDRA